MVRKRMKVLLSLIIGTTIVSLGVSEIPKTNMEADYEIISNLKNFEFKQVQAKLDVEIQKIKEAEAKRLEEEKRKKELEEQQRKQPHFNPYNVTEPSNLSKEQLHKMLEGTALVTVVDALYWYEQEYGVNSIFITSIIALESGWGESSLSRTHNNLGGYKSKDGGYYTFADWGESVQETFRLISEEYTNENGLFYNGKSVYDINIRYCELGSWSNKVISIGNELLSKIN